jgi:AcrR family transcriptional regulator
VPGPPTTQSRILDAAEHLYSERGIAGTSLRAVTSEAGVNVAAVHYHFGSKDGLTRALVRRRAAGVNSERERLLDQAESDAAPHPPAVEAILDAFLRPVFTLHLEGSRDAMVSYLVHEPVEQIGPLVAECMGGVVQRFLGATHSALPDLPRTVRVERWQLVIASMLQVISGRFGREPLALPDYRLEALLRAVITPLAAALRAPATPESRS